MRLHRFYVNKPLGEEIVVDNAGEEKELIHQWTHVFRFQSGDEVFLFSPSHEGYDYRYRFSSLDKREASLLLVSQEPNIPLDQEQTLVMALVKKDTFETVVRQATELGITRIIPLAASRSEKKNLNFERLKAISIEASEQCGRGTIPTISPISAWEEVITQLKGTKQVAGSLYGEQLKGIVLDPKAPLALWVGPEGGWTPEEEESLEKEGVMRLKLTDTVLKADTAAVALLSAIQSLS
jgi:16S rRNA (uracil1498-N3)-methyltransferase